jgi:hypothetical protein
MARQGNSTSVGLGWSHQRDRKRAMAAMPDGTPCPYDYCGHAPMYKQAARNYDGRALHYDHVIARALGGVNGPRQLAHATCNEKAGRALLAKLRRGRPGPRPQRAEYTRW